MAQGSKVTYKSHPSSRHEPSFLFALCSAMTSAWLLAQAYVSRRLCPRAMICPSRTITAPIGHSPFFSAFFASAIAASIYFSSNAIQKLHFRANSGASVWFYFKKTLDFCQEICYIKTKWKTILNRGPINDKQTAPNRGFKR